MAEADLNSTASKNLDGHVVQHNLAKGEVIIAYLCYAGTIVANFYGFSMIATGLINAKLLPANAVFGIFSHILYYAVAAFVQVGILVVYLSWPLRSKNQRLVNAITTFLWSILVLMAIFFSIFSITLSSRGDELVRSNDESISDIANRINDLDKVMFDTYQSQIANLDSMYTDSCRGRDRTGVARCGSIATGFQDRRQWNVSHFGAYLAKKEYPKAEPNQTHFAQIQTLNGNFESLRSKVGHFKEFARYNGVESTSIDTQVKSIENRLRDVNQKIGDRSLNKNEIAFKQVFSDISDAFGLKASWQFWLAFVIAALPDLMSLVFVLVLKIVANTTAQERVLMQDIETAGRLSGLYKRAAAAARQASDSYSAWSAARRERNMKRAVDTSVPDS